MERKVTIGIVGCGWIACHVYIPLLLKNKMVYLKAICDSNCKRLDEIVKNFSIPNAYIDFNEFLSCGLDGIIITSPNYTHVQYAIQAINKKINVLCEKPIAFKTDEIKNIINLARKNKVVFFPGFVNRWRKDIVLTMNLVRSGMLGSIKKVEGGWIRKSGIPRPGTWFTNKKFSGGGVLIDLGSHVIDICNMFLGNQSPSQYSLLTSFCVTKEEQKASSASWFFRDTTWAYDMDVENVAVGDIKFVNGSTINIKLGWSSPLKADCTYFKIEGSKGDLHLKTLFGFSKERLWPEDLLETNINGTKKEIVFKQNENHTEQAFSNMLSDFIYLIMGQNGSDESILMSACKTVFTIENLYKNEVVDSKKCLKYILEEV